MLSQDWIVAITVLFIIGMIWLRTRMQYTRRGAGAPQLERAGRIYFASALGMLLIGSLAAPMLGRALWPRTGATPALMRVVSYLATYYIFIVVHRFLRARGTAVFRYRDESTPAGPGESPNPPHGQKSASPGAGLPRT